ncbi:MAG TPA: OmpW family outer membrane protein [Rhodospirillales bacterium]|nr:OmpW family outer membrane protein [Rhodospirillales bacterium]
MNKMKKAALALLTGAVLIGASGGAEAKEAGDLLVRLRGIGVIPDESGRTTIGGDIDIGDAYAPELDFSYFFTKNIAAELILATARHEVKVKDTALGDVDLGHVWLLPPTLTLQYHFFTENKVSPYVGAGVNYTVFYGVDKPNNSLIDDVDYDNRFGWALQAGVDWEVWDRWSVNFDVKKLWLPAAVSVNDGAVKSRNADIDPWIIGVGIGYRFSL